MRRHPLLVAGIVLAVVVVLGGATVAILAARDLGLLWDGPGTFPTRSSVGLPAGWVPVKTVTGDYKVSTPGAVVEDLKVVDGAIIVAAPNVTLRRIQLVGSEVVNDQTGKCMNGLVVEHAEFTPNGTTRDQDPPVIGPGGYTLSDSVIDGVPEGARVGGIGEGCGPVTIQNTYIRVASPDVCNDWHGDGIQGYDGNSVTIRQVSITMTVTNNCYGTAPFFYPKSQGNTSADIDGLLVSGGGYPFRDGMPGAVKHLYVVSSSWVFGPVDANCSAFTAWDAHVATLDANGQPIPGKTITCTGTGS